MLFRLVRPLSSGLPRSSATNRSAIWRVTTAATSASGRPRDIRHVISRLSTRSIAMHATSLDLSVSAFLRFSSMSKRWTASAARPARSASFSCAPVAE